MVYSYREVTGENNVIYEMNATSDDNFSFLSDKWVY